MKDAPLLVFEQVTFGYNSEPAVRNITLSVQQGDFVALVGPNGGGKSTLVKLALGLLHPHEGRVLLWGQEVARFREWRRLGYVPQRAEGFDREFPGTVAEVVAQGLYHGLDPLAFLRRGISRPVKDALDTVGMWGFRGRRIGHLSVGQQQRVVIGRALVRKPDLLILDEPMAGVDVPAQESFYALLEQLNKQGIAILLVSHDIGTVLKAVNKVACINGKLVYHGAPEDFPLEALPELYGLPITPLEHWHE